MQKAAPFKSNQFTFVHESHRGSTDVDAFLGPFEEGEEATIVWFDDATWADLAVSLGIFPSKGQARKNGWGQELPHGLTNRQQKKGAFVKRDIWVLNAFHSE